MMPTKRSEDSENDVMKADFSKYWNFLKITAMVMESAFSYA